MSDPDLIETPPAEDAPQAPVETPLSIGEWCARRSVTDKRVELIGAFFSYQKDATPKAVSSQYDGLFEAFASMPA